MSEDLTPETAKVSAPLWLLLIRAAALVATAATLWLAFKTPGGEGQWIPGDKAGHFLSFYVLTLLFCLALPRTPRLAIAVLLLVGGGAIEVVQGFVGRDADWKDWIADLMGVAAALLPMGLDRVLRHAFRARPGDE